MKSGKRKPSEQPRVSVVIPCYNLGRYLVDAVESVRAQSYRQWELIVVDDGSDDAYTLKQLERLKGSGVKVLRTRNRGLPRARNAGITLARGEYICCLDADDKYHRDFLKLTVPLLDGDKRQKLGFVTSWVQYFGEAEGTWRTSDYNPARLAAENAIHVASLFRKKCWRQVGGYATNLSGYQDWNFWISIASRGFRWACVHKPLFHYRKRSGSMVTVSDRKRSALMRKIIDNNHKFFVAHLADILDEKDKITLRKKKMLANRDRSLEKNRQPFKAVKDDLVLLLRSRLDRLRGGLGRKRGGKR